jgi:hypothetical protein
MRCIGDQLPNDAKARPMEPKPPRLVEVAPAGVAVAAEPDDADEFELEKKCHPLDPRDDRQVCELVSATAPGAGCGQLYDWRA